MLRTISVFEYETLKVDERSGTSDFRALTSAEHAALARFNDRHKQRYFSVGYRSITFRQFVGYLQVGDLGIEVLPKTDRGRSGDPASWRDMLLEMIRVSLSLDLRTTDDAAQELQRSSLLALVIAAFVTKIELLAREGLARGYRAEELNGTTFRGRLCVADHIRHNHSRRDRCFVRYVVYDRDIEINRYLHAALTVAARCPIPGPLRTRVVSAARNFETVANTPPRGDTFERLIQHLGRSTERYRDALELARLVLESLSPALNSGSTEVFALLFDINILWERYIAALFRRARCPGARVVLQQSRSFWLHADGTRRLVRPDILVFESSTGETRVERASVLAVLDTKWKLADARGPSEDHLKQMFAYSELFQAPRAILLCPAVEPRADRITGIFASSNRRCEVYELALIHEGKARSPAIVAQIRALLDSLALKTELLAPRSSELPRKTESR